MRRGGSLEGNMANYVDKNAVRYANDPSKFDCILFLTVGASI